MFGFDPITIGVGALIWAVFKKQSDSKSMHGINTPERELIFKNAMEFAEAPRLIEAAKIFERDGLKAQAYFLRKRAEWRSRSAETKAKHDAIFTQAMNSDKIDGILGVAKLFEEYTATIKATALRERAKSLSELRAKKEAEVVEKAKAEAEALKAVADKVKGESNPQGASTNGIMTSHNAEQVNGGLRSSTETP